MEIYFNVQFASGFPTNWYTQFTGCLSVSTPLHRYISFDTLLLSDCDKEKLKMKTMYLPFANAFYIQSWHLCFYLCQRMLVIIIMNVESCRRKVVSCWVSCCNICCTMLHTNFYWIVERFYNIESLQYAHSCWKDDLVLWF